MFRWFIIRTLTLWIIIALAMGVAIAIAQTHSDRELIRELDWCNGIGCFLGILPNQKTIEDAKTIVKNSGSFGFTGDSDNAAYKLSQPFYRLNFVPDKYDANKVRELTLEFPADTRFNAGFVIAYFGMPCRVRLLSDQPGSIGLFYPGMVFTFSTAGQNDTSSLKTDSPLEEINVFDSQACQWVTKDNDAIYNWSGFVRYAPKN